MIKINNKIIKPSYFPDGTLKLNCEISTYTKINDVIKFEWYFDNNEELLILDMLIKHIRSNYFFKHFHLFMPYVPNSRMDRVENDTDVFTLKWFCDAINSMNFEVVHILHPHSYVTTALLNNVVVDKLNEDIINTIIDIQKPDVIYYPDEGCKKNFKEKFIYPTLCGSKDRDWKTGEINDLNIIGNIPSKDFSVLIVDDICSKGETCFYSAKKLKELGAQKINLYITHCENTILESELLNSDLINQIYTTDSIFTKKHKLINVVTNFRDEE